MATATASLDENPKVPTDLNLIPPSIEVASTTQHLPAHDAGSDELKGEQATTETADASGGGAATDIQKKTKRAERFGMTVILSEEEKRNSRAERFGAGNALNGADSSKDSSKQSKDSSKQSEELKRKARGERFGVVKSSTADEEVKKKADEEVKKKARLSRFGSSPPTDPAEEEKMKARTLRFTQPDSSSKTNREGDINVNTTVVARAGGGT